MSGQITQIARTALGGGRSRYDEKQAKTNKRRTRYQKLRKSQKEKEQENKHALRAKAASHEDKVAVCW